MERKEVESKLNNYHLGTYLKMVVKGVNDNGVKITRCVVRITNKAIKTNKNGIDYLTMRITKNANHKVKNTYFDHNGVEISKEQYENGIAKQEVKDYFSKHLVNIISIG